MDRLLVSAGLMAGLAHDLTNHLGVIETSAHLARTSPEKHFARIDDHVRHAQSLLRAVMAVARGEALVTSASPVGDLVTLAVAASGARVAAAPMPAGAIVVCQPTLVAQALINLLANAASAAGPEGRIAITWDGADDASAPERGVFVISDDGPGFPAGFDIGGALHTTKEGGTGLGLVVARAVAELHGGGLDVTRDGGETHVALRLGSPGPS